MVDVLKTFYNAFYIPPDLSELETEAERCRVELSKRLNSPERKLVLCLINAQDELTDRLSMDSFAAGFNLALHLCIQLQELPTIDPESYYRGRRVTGDGGAA